MGIEPRPQANGFVRLFNVAFDVTIGANTLARNGTVVFDNGSFGCNDDGTPDHNVISKWLGPVRAWNASYARWAPVSLTHWGELR
jgi:hypothetical protein